MTAPIRCLFAALVTSALLAPAAGAIERSAVETRFKWDLTALYPSESAWSRAKDELAARIPGMAAFQGHLGESPHKLYEALAARMDPDRDLSRLQTYASQLPD